MQVRKPRRSELGRRIGTALVAAFLPALLAPNGLMAQPSSTVQQDGIVIALSADEPQTVTVRWRFLKPIATPLSDIVATINGRPLGVPAVGAYPEAGDRTGLLLLLDTSGADRGDQIQKDKIDLLKLAAKVKPHQQIAIGVYSATPRMLLPEDRDAVSVVTMLAASQPAPEPANLGETLAFASLLLMQTAVERRGIVTFTDGHSDDKVDVEMLLARARAASITYDFVVTGSSRAADLESLKRLAEGSGGQVFMPDRREAVSGEAFAVLDSGGVARFPLQDARRMPWESAGKVEVAVNYGSQTLRLASDIDVPVASMGEAAAALGQVPAVRIGGAGLAVAVVLAAAALLYRRRRARAETATADSPKLKPTPEPMSAHLTALEDIEKGTIFPITKPLVRIGRNDDNDIVIKDPSVGRFHAVIQQVGDQLYSIVDQSSANGTLVNNKPVSTWALSEGDLVALGTKILRFHRGLRQGAS